jgi:hypothetical protein
VKESEASQAADAAPPAEPAQAAPPAPRLSSAEQLRHAVAKRAAAFIKVPEPGNRLHVSDLSLVCDCCWYLWCLGIRGTNGRC